MKKLKICLLLFLSMAFVFTGCAGINGYLKTTETTLPVATFFHNNYLQGVLQGGGEGMLGRPV